MKKIIIAAKRTPIGKFLGSFYESDPLDVCLQVLSTLTSNLSKADFSIGIFGNAIEAGMGQAFSRAMCLKAGFPVEMPSYTINMVCGSGARAVINACQEIELGSELSLCGGYEFMSNVPYATNTYLRLGKKFGNFEMVDLMIKDGLTDYIDKVHMGITAENIAEMMNVSREEQDHYSYLSQKKTIAAVDSGAFKEEIVPITLRDYKGKPFICSTDEFPNRDSTPEKLASLKPVFKSGGTVTAGNTSGINDGACFLAIASERYAKEHNCNQMAEIVDFVSVGCDHRLMGLGPFYAIKNLLQKNHLHLSDISLLEINEAFAAQLLADVKMLAKEYSTPQEEILNKLNPNGSGLGLGHPLGCTGARIVTTLTYEMKARGLSGKYGIASLCIGGGQGIAILMKGL